MESNNGTKSIDVQLRTPLAAPRLVVSGNGLTWEAVEGAVSYQIKVNDGEPTNVTVPGYTFESVAGEYRVSVIAVADLAKYNSEAATFSYTSVETAITGLSAAYEVISWTSFAGLGLEVKKGDGAYADITTSTYTAPENGGYTLHAKAGFDSSTNKFYFEGTNGTKSINIAYREPLAAPVLAVNSNKNGLTWEAVAGAVSYQVTVKKGDAEPTTKAVNEPGYAFAEESGVYEVKVKANADVAQYSSAEATFTYTVANTAVGELGVQNGEITWSSVIGKALEVKLNDGEFAAVDGDKVLVTKAGEYTFRATAGYDEENKIFYTHNDEVVDLRSIVAAPNAANILALEVGDEPTSSDLQDKYVIKFYDYKNGWVDVAQSKADVALSNANEGIYTMDQSKAIDILYKREDAPFKYELAEDPVIDKNYNALSFTTKGIPEGKFKIQFAVNPEDEEEKIVVGSGENAIELNGVYMTLETNLTADWTRHIVSFDDSRWVITYDKKDLTFAQVQGVLAQSNIKVNHLSELLPYFNKVSFMLQCAHDTNWSLTHAYLAEFALGYIPENQQIPADDTLYKVISGFENYAFESNNSHGTLNMTNTGFVLNIDGMPGLPVTVQPDLPYCVNITSETENYDFEAKIKSVDGGYNFVLEGEPTGSLAPGLAGLKVSTYTMLENFESYDATGVGYDKTHAKDERTGLRAKFFCDYYGGGKTSPVGGDGWDLMGSSDYLDLNTTNAFNGTKSARMKYNASNQMRFMSYGLSDGSATALPKGSTLSFWTKRMSSRGNNLVVRAYYVNQVTPSNQGSNFTQVQEFVPQGTGWHEVKVKLDPSKTYYGFAILPLTYNGGTGGDGQYFFIDDIAIYNDINPAVVPVKQIALKDHYAFESAAVSGRMDVISASNYVLTLNDQNSTQLPVTVEANDAKTELTITSVVPTHDFVAKLASDDYGENLALTSVTGTIKDMFAGLKVSAYYVLNNFESYDATGVGYDKNNTKESRSGLRADFYCDYYGGGSTSPVGGSGWDLMGSSDYLNLHEKASEEDVKTHNGTKSAEFKYNKGNQMRFMSYDLSTSSASPLLPHCTTLSMWVKIPTNGAKVVKFRAYYVNQVTPSNQGSNFTEVQFNVETEDWVEIKVTLDPTRTYRGICILPVTNSSQTTGMFYVDDICMYSAISPWGN